MYIEHMALYVKDLELCRNFFVKYFEAKSGNLYCNLKTGFSSYFLTFEGGARLEIMKKREITVKEKINKLGYAHIAFSLESKERVDELTEKLKNDGYEVISKPRITGDGYYESCILDCEGNVIELTV